VGFDSGLIFLCTVHFNTISETQRSNSLCLLLPSIMDDFV